MSFFTALRPYSIKRLEEVNSIDLLIGIPCFNNDETIGAVVETASRGAAEFFPDLKTLIFVSDGGSTDDTRDFAHDTVLEPFQEKIVQIYRGIPGKGSALRAVFEAANYLKPRVAVVVDADLRSITPDWVKRLADPIVGNSVDFVAPLYSRYKYDGTITNNIAYNMIRTLYGRQVRQPIGGDFAFSLDLAEDFLKEDVWDTDVAAFGIDIWMTTVAITSGKRICQARLGPKTHGKKDPGVHLGTMFREVVATMFNMMEKYDHVWKEVKGSKPVKTVGEAPAEEPEEFPVDKGALVENFQLGYSHFRPLWKSILSPEAYSAVREIKNAGPDEMELDIEAWARILYDFSVTFHTWPRDKVKLVNTMTPLYYAQVASFVNQTEKMTNAEAEGVIEENAGKFEELKPYLVKKWNRAEEEARREAVGARKDEGRPPAERDS